MRRLIPMCRLFPNCGAVLPGTAPIFGRFRGRRCWRAHQVEALWNSQPIDLRRHVSDHARPRVL